MKICNREFAVDFCLNRHAHEWELKRSELKDGEGEEKTPVGSQREGEEPEKGQGEEGESGDDDEEEDQSGDDETDAAQGDEGEDEEEDEAEGDEEDDEEEDDEEAEGEDDEEDEEDGEESMEDGEKKAQAAPAALADVSEGRTVFVRYSMPTTDSLFLDPPQRSALRCYPCRPQEHIWTLRPRGARPDRQRSLTFVSVSHLTSPLQTRSLAWREALASSNSRLGKELSLPSRALRSALALRWQINESLPR
jgi:hypothetical protein